MAFPSTFLDLQRTVQDKLRLEADADTAAGTDLQKIKDTLNQVYAQVCIQIEANQASGTAALTTGVSSYALPADVIRIKSLIIQPSGQTSYGAPLTETGLEDILTKRQGSGGTTGTATHYAVLGVSQLELWPAPAGNDTALFYYVALPTVLSADVDVPILQEPYSSKVLEYGALAELSDFLLGTEHPRTVAYRDLFEKWLQRYRVQLSRKAGGKSLQLQIVGAGRYAPHDPSTDTNGC